MKLYGYKLLHVTLELDDLPHHPVTFPRLQPPPPPQHRYFTPPPPPPPRPPHDTAANHCLVYTLYIYIQELRHAH